MQHLFLIEDDLKLANLISKFLNKQGYSLDVFNTVHAYLNFEQTVQPTLIICDIMLPDGDGFELMNTLKQKHTCPIIFLTALDSVDSQIKGLNMGAYDYLVKPIKPELLLAKVKNIIAHNNKLTEPDGTLKIDNHKQEVYLLGTALQVNENEFEIIAYLANNAPKPVSREVLFEHVIGREYDGLDRAIDLKISRLRKKIKELPLSEQVSFDIKSIRGKGYSLDISKP